MTRFWRFTTALLCTLFFQGCAHHQLRFNTAGHAKTVADVHTQQVLDNLAKFVANPNSLPHFEYPNQGGSGVTDDVNGSAGANFNPYNLTSWSFGFGGRRTSAESFTMTPVNDPRKLELMRCAYQRAINACCCNNESANCPDCNARLNNFYLGTTTPSKTAMTTEDGRPILLFAEIDANNEALLDLNQNPIGQRVVANANSLDQTYYVDLETGEIVLTVEQAGQENNKNRLKKLYVDDSVAQYTDRNGTVTVSCLGGQCWFKVGKKSVIPRDCLSCGYVGRYCGTYVWVPECGRDQLTKLTLTILDIALNDPPKSRTKEVVAFLDASQALTTEENASFRITATIPLSAKVKDVVPGVTKTSQIVKKLQIEHSVAKETANNAAESFENSKSTFQTSIMRLNNLVGADAKKLLTDLQSGGQVALGIEDLAIALEQARGRLLTDKSEQKTLDEAIASAQKLIDAKRQLSLASEREAKIRDLLRETEASVEIERLSNEPDLRTQNIDTLPQERTFDPAGGILQLDQRLKFLGQ